MDFHISWHEFTTGKCAFPQRCSRHKVNANRFTAFWYRWTTYANELHAPDILLLPNGTGFFWIDISQTKVSKVGFCHGMNSFRKPHSLLVVALGWSRTVCTGGIINGRLHTGRQRRCLESSTVTIGGRGEAPERGRNPTTNKQASKRWTSITDTNRHRQANESPGW